MNHWRQVLPIPLHEQRYEALVADPKRRAAHWSLIASCHGTIRASTFRESTVQSPLPVDGRYDSRFIPLGGPLAQLRAAAGPFAANSGESEHSYRLAGVRLLARRSPGCA